MSQHSLQVEIIFGKTVSEEVENRLWYELFSILGIEQYSDFEEAIVEDTEF